MKKILTLFLLLAMVTVTNGCRSKCAPLDRTYPSRQDKNQAQATQADQVTDRVSFALSNCNKQQFAFIAKPFIGG
ncbi:MAG: hypothetical protein QM529_00490 [Hydrotalea sp.]|nr:hypothetical protein [Hydrotalea sp.]